VTTAPTRARCRSGERLLTVLGLRYVTVAAVAVVLAAVHLPRRPPTFCVLREFTGVPCPFCGGTTALSQLGRGRIDAALAASPLALLTAITAPALGHVSMPAWLASRRRRWAVVLVVLAFSEMWQLERFGLL
jgi:hypothetical protein